MIVHPWILFFFCVSVLKGVGEIESDGFSWIFQGFTKSSVWSFSWSSGVTQMFI